MTDTPQAKCLFIGNSHIRAIRDALEATPDRWAGLEVDTFGFRGAALPEVEVAHGHLRATGNFAKQQFESLNNGHRQWAITGYDAIIVVGFDFKPLDVVALSRAAVWPGLPSLTQAEDIATMRQTMMSRAAAKATIDASLDGCDAAKLVRGLRAEVDTPVFLVACPRLNQRAKWVADVPRFFGHGRAIKQGDAEELDLLWEQAARQVSRRIGARYLAQPRQTIAENILTRRKFMADGEVMVPTVNGPKKVPDLTHANADYGALMLQKLVTKLAA